MAVVCYTRICFALFFLLFTPQCQGARILGLFTAPSKSHLLVHTAIIDALVEQGHEATVITTGPIMKNKINYRHFNLNIEGFSAAQVMQSVNGRPPSYSDFLEFVGVVTRGANSSINHPIVKKMMDEESFDLMILGYFFNEFQLGLAAHFKCPVIISFMAQPIHPLNGMVGNPKEMPYVPNLFFSGMSSLSFWSRLQNFVSTVMFDEVAFPFISDFRQAALYE